MGFLAPWTWLRQGRDARVCCNDEETSSLLTGRRGQLLQSPQPVLPEDDIGVPEGPVAGILQFSSPLYYCTEEEGEVLIEVVRIGERNTVASISFTTQDSSAKGGVKYEAQSGTLEFAPGDVVKTIRVPIMNDDSFDAALDFCVTLYNVRGAGLAKYLKTCRVVIIDDDTFPTNRFADLIQGKKIEKIPALALMTEYAKMNLRPAGIRWPTIKSLVLDQVKNLYFILTVYLQIYMIDVVLAPELEEELEEEDAVHDGAGPQQERRLLLWGIQAAARFLSEAGADGHEEGIEPFGGKLLVDGDRKQTGLVVGILYIVPFLFLQLIDIQKVRFGIAGRSRQNLQANLLRKFFNYSEGVRTGISSAEVTMTMIRDVAEVVNHGFMKIIEVFQILGKVAMSCVFILAENRLAAIPLVVNPIIMGLFLYMREGITVKTNEAMAQKQNSVVQSMHDAVKNFRLLADFELKPHVVDMFEETIIEYNASEVRSQIVSTNNSYLPQWLITVLIGVYMMLGTVLVNTCGGTLSLGTFLATINIFKETGRELAEVYVQMSEVVKASGPLRKVTELMNMETDLEERMRVMRLRQHVGHQRREEVSPKAGGRRPSQGSTLNVDHVPIEISDVTFAYGHSRPMLEHASGTFPQGGLYAIVGEPHQGKGTLLRLLGEVLIVEDGNGFIFVPPHLQILHVSHETCILENSSLYTNIVFNQEPKGFGGPERVKAIFRLLGFADDLIARLEDGAGEHGEDEGEEEALHNAPEGWTACLSHTDLARLNLARALVLNPEFMVLHKPILYFDENEASRIIGLLRRHVDERGLEVLHDKPSQRRPRTVIFTSSTMFGLQAVDKVYEVANRKLHVVPEETVMMHCSRHRLEPKPNRMNGHPGGRKRFDASAQSAAARHNV